MLRPFLFLLFLSMNFWAQPISGLSQEIKTQSLSNPVDVRYVSLLDSSRAYLNNNPQKALELAQSAFEYKDSISTPTLIVKYHNQIGRIFFNLGLMDLAADNFLKSLEIINTQSNYQEIDFLDTYIGLGAVYLFLQEFDKAESNFDRAMAQINSGKEPNYLSLSSIYNNLGIIYREQNEIESAYQILNRGIELLEANDPQNLNFSLLNNNLGEIHQKTGKYDLAEQAFMKSLSFSRNQNDQIGIATTYKNLGELYLASGDRSKSLYYFRLSYELASSIEALVISLISSNQLAELYQQSANADSTVYFLQVSKEAQNNLDMYKAKNVLLAEELRAEFESREASLAQELNKQRKIYVLLFLSLVIGLVGAVVFSLRNKKKADRLNVESLSKKQQIEKIEMESRLLETQLEEKEKKIAVNLVNSAKQNQLIKEVVDKLIAYRNRFNGEQHELIRGVINDLKSSQEDDLFNEFESSFLNLHQDFYTNLTREFPSLSLNEKRICAFVRLNLNNKEIASITGQTIPTLNMAKTRLRKKLGLTNTDESLNDLLCRF